MNSSKKPVPFNHSNGAKPVSFLNIDWKIRPLFSSAAEPACPKRANLTFWPKKREALPAKPFMALPPAQLPAKSPPSSAMSMPESSPSTCPAPSYIMPKLAPMSLKNCWTRSFDLSRILRPTWLNLAEAGWMTSPNIFSFKIMCAISLEWIFTASGKEVLTMILSYADLFNSKDCSEMSKCLRWTKYCR